ncbi:hypothetical protein FB45DRAFT_756567 [Roridomyces roridus]|uniref:Terpenoid synthase n=1 Tax=Roridomyces roridus TaxID=1738132 RepID=A0AAD7BD29_9AGAR|nr:hypothetical protein FB45DRAFT_756567 [Roridomyces roridus]
MLALLYKHWAPVLANSMGTAVLDAISATVLESGQDIIEMENRVTARGWPWYMRTKTGLAPGFSCTIFPLAAHPDITAYIKALPDMDKQICFINDILSFYKEELAGEETNYVSLRAKVEGKDPKRVLVEMVEETAVLHQSIGATLDGQREVLAAWAAFQNGYIAWHLSVDRYKLGTDLGFTWQSRDIVVVQPAISISRFNQ